MRGLRHQAAGGAVAIFARVPVPGRAKTRLISLLGREGAARLQGAFVADMLRKAAQLRGGLAHYLFVTGGRLLELPGLRRLRVERQRGSGLGRRLAGAFRLLIPRHGWAIIVGTDSPTLPLTTLRQAQRELRVCDAVLGPCPDGGYYLIGLRRYAAGIFSGVRWGSAYAFRDTLRNLMRAEFSCSILGSYPDVDRPGDVGWLAGEFQANPALRHLAPATWRFLKDCYVQRLRGAWSSS